MSWLSPLTKLFKKKVEKKVEQKVDIPGEKMTRVSRAELVPEPISNDYHLESETDKDSSVLSTVGQSNIFNEAEQRTICEMIAMFRPYEEIKSWVKSLGKHIGTSGIGYYRYSPEWKLEVAKYRKRYIARIEEIPLANKIKRVEKLEDQFYRLETIEQTKDGAGTRAAVMKEQRAVLKQIQEEIEGDGKEVFVRDILQEKFSQMSLKEMTEYRLKLAEVIERFKRKELEDATASLRRYS